MFVCSVQICLRRAKVFVSCKEEQCLAHGHMIRYSIVSLRLISDQPVLVFPSVRLWCCRFYSRLSLSCVIIVILFDAVVSQENACARCLLKTCICCLWCLEKCLNYLNQVTNFPPLCLHLSSGCKHRGLTWVFVSQNAYAATAINSTSFCTSARDAFVILVENALRVATINAIGDFVLFLGKVRWILPQAYPDPVLTQVLYYWVSANPESDLILIWSWSPPLFNRPVPDWDSESELGINMWSPGAGSAVWITDYSWGLWLSVDLLFCFFDVNKVLKPSPLSLSLLDVFPQVLIVTSTAFAGVLLLNYQRDYAEWLLPLIIVCLFSFLVAHCFLSIFEIVVDVLFLCFAIDTKYNDGTPGKEFFMDKALMVSPPPRWTCPTVRYESETDVSGGSLYPLNHWEAVNCQVTLLVHWSSLINENNGNERRVLEEFYIRTVSPAESRTALQTRDYTNLILLLSVKHVLLCPPSSVQLWQLLENMCVARCHYIYTLIITLV